jgi:hypothetical protein
MIRFTTQEDKQYIELLNQALGMKYRSTPYDFNNPVDIVEAVTQVTAEYADMAHYWAQVSTVDENIDETVEVFNPAAWMKMTLSGHTGDPIIDEALHYVEQAANALAALMDQAEENCRKCWHMVLLIGPAEVRREFFGQDISVDVETVEEVLNDNLFDIFSEMKYDGTVRTSVSEFALVLKRWLLDDVDADISVKDDSFEEDILYELAGSVIAKAIADPNLSWGAKGMFSCMVQHDFVLTFSDLMKQAKSGRTAVKSHLNELIEYKYIKQHKDRNHLSWGFYPELMLDALAKMKEEVLNDTNI